MRIDFRLAQARSRPLRYLSILTTFFVLVACTESSQPQVQAKTSVGVGEKIYAEYCFSCHTPGLNGAPKLGDAEAWAPRIALGKSLLLQTTIEGIPPAMPPRGICMSCTDEELIQAIEYMVVESQ